MRLTREEAKWFPSIHRIIDACDWVREQRAVEAHVDEYLTSNQRVAGSRPVNGSNCECEEKGMPLACGKCTEPEWLMRT